MNVIDMNNQKHPTVSVPMHALDSISGICNANDSAPSSHMKKNQFLGRYDEENCGIHHCPKCGLVSRMKTMFKSHIHDHEFLSDKQRFIAIHMMEQSQKKINIDNLTTPLPVEHLDTNLISSTEKIQNNAQDASHFKSGSLLSLKKKYLLDRQHYEKHIQANQIVNSMPIKESNITAQIENKGYLVCIAKLHKKRFEELLELKKKI